LFFNVWNFKVIGTTVNSSYFPEWTLLLNFSLAQSLFQFFC